MRSALLSVLEVAAAETVVECREPCPAAGADLTHIPCLAILSAELQAVDIRACLPSRRYQAWAGMTTMLESLRAHEITTPAPQPEVRRAAMPSLFLVYQTASWIQAEADALATSGCCILGAPAGHRDTIAASANRSAFAVAGHVIVIAHRIITVPDFSSFTPPHCVSGQAQAAVRAGLRSCPRTFLLQPGMTHKPS
jgi:hypothetical protein